MKWLALAMVLVGCDCGPGVECKFTDVGKFLPRGCASQAVCDGTHYWWQCICPSEERFCACTLERELYHPNLGEKRVRATSFEEQWADPCGDPGLIQRKKDNLNAVIAAEFGPEWV